MPVHVEGNKMSELVEQLKRSRKAATVLAACSREQKDHALRAMASRLLEMAAPILAANEEDVKRAQELGVKPSLVDRLRLTPARIQEMSDGLLALAALPDPVGEIMESWTQADGLRIDKVRVPFGVIAMIYESRPNVTVDAAGLAIKAGSAAVLRGGSDALQSNQAIVAVLRQALAETQVPEDAVQLVSGRDRGIVGEMLRMNGWIDLVIPRGGAGLIRYVVENATVPVIETGVGNCHVYVDADADPDMALRIILNAKTQRPGVCNAAETLLVHRDIAGTFLPGAVASLEAKGVEVRGCEVTREICPTVKAATEEDYAEEFLSLTLAVRVVDGLEEALDHIARYGTRHSETIVTNHPGRAAQFLQAVDAAVVYHNASTRFTDGFQFGFGAEIGISTQKLHARGPMGLREITTYKYMVHGQGQIRS
jgi:glutamate-5-semialdehyde dehydrogenase